jgi:hypothetical protein
MATFTRSVGVMTEIRLTMKMATQLEEGTAVSLDLDSECVFSILAQIKPAV